MMVWPATFNVLLSKLVLNSCCNSEIFVDFFLLFFLCMDLWHTDLLHFFCSSMFLLDIIDNQARVSIFVSTSGFHRPELGDRWFQRHGGWWLKNSGGLRRTCHSGVSSILIFPFCCWFTNFFSQVQLPQLPMPCTIKPQNIPCPIQTCSRMFSNHSGLSNYMRTHWVPTCT